MNGPPDTPSGAIERAVLITCLFKDGETFTTQEAADLLGVTWGGAHYLLCVASVVIPLYQDEDKIWRILDPSQSA